MQLIIDSLMSDRRALESSLFMLIWPSCKYILVIDRALREDPGITDPNVKAPALFIMGGKDYVNKFPGMEDYINSGKVKQFVPNLEIVFLPEGTHFVQEQSPEEVNQLIVTFLGKHIWLAKKKYYPWLCRGLCETFGKMMQLGVESYT